MSYQQPATMAETTYAGRATSSNYGQPAARQPRDAHADHSMANLTSTLANSHLGVPGAANMPGAGGVAINHFPMGGHYFYTHEGQLVYAPGPAFQPPQVGPTQLADTNFAPYAAPMQFMPQAFPSMPAYMQSFPIAPYSPGRGGHYADRQESLNLNKEVPGLENRRGSYSTTESTPGTPYYGSSGSRDHGGHIAVLDRSPVYSTPSPQALTNAHIVAAHVKPLPYKTTNINNTELDGILAQHPAIPHAVPAVFTPRENMRTLEQSLINIIQGNRNVYIRGLHPNTDDETLVAYCIRFGEIETSKAIIDTATGACKG